MVHTTYIVGELPDEFKSIHETQPQILPRGFGYLVSKHNANLIQKVIILDNCVPAIDQRLGRVLWGEARAVGSGYSWAQW